MSKILFSKEDDYGNLMTLIYYEEEKDYVLFINNVEGATVTYKDVCNMCDEILRNENYFEE